MKILEKGARWYWVLVRCVVFSNTSKSALDKTTNIDPWASPLLYTPSFDFSLVKTNFSEMDTGKTFDYTPLHFIFTRNLSRIF